MKARTPRAAGNGSIMRLAPVALFFYPDLEAVARFSAESSRTTHGAAECVDACRWLGLAIGRALAGGSKDEVLLGDGHGYPSPSIQAISRGGYRGKTRGEVRGTGYVVASLEAALWCFATTGDYAAAVLEAANLGEDADTTAAVCGQLAGAFYGKAGIPGRWVGRLAMGDAIEELATRLFEGVRA